MIPQKRHKSSARRSKRRHTREDKSEDQIRETSSDADVNCKDLNKKKGVHSDEIFNEIEASFDANDDRNDGSDYGSNDDSNKDDSGDRTDDSGNEDFFSDSRDVATENRTFDTSNDADSRDLAKQANPVSGKSAEDIKELMREYLSVAASEFGPELDQLRSLIDFDRDTASLDMLKDTLRHGIVPILIEPQGDKDPSDVSSIPYDPVCGIDYSKLQGLVNPD